MNHTSKISPPTAPHDAEASQDQQESGRILSPEAQRALEEAQARRDAASQADVAKEIGGRKGPDPVRFGDWEVGGIASDF